jgi:hypothetical protein
MTLFTWVGPCVDHVGVALHPPEHGERSVRRNVGKAPGMPSRCRHIATTSTTALALAAGAIGLACNDESRPEDAPEMIEPTMPEPSPGRDDADLERMEPGQPPPNPADPAPGGQVPTPGPTSPSDGGVSPDPGGSEQAP